MAEKPKSHKLKLQLSLPKSFSLPDNHYLWNHNPIFITILNYIELILLVLFPIVFFRESNANLQLQWLIGIVVILFIVKVVKALFFGLKALGGVSFDLIMLSNITLLLIITIIQGNNANYANLGGANVVGVGIIMLVALLIYLYTTSTRRSFHTQLFIVTIMGGLLTAFISALTTPGFSTITLDTRLPLYAGIVGLIAVIISISAFVYYRNIYSRVIFILTVIIAVPVFILSLSWLEVMILAITFLLTGILLVSLQERRPGSKMIGIVNLKTNWMSLTTRNLSPLKFIAKHLGILLIFLGLFLTIITIIAAKTNPAFGETLASIRTSYPLIDNIVNTKNIRTGFTDTIISSSIGSLIVGSGLGVSSTTLAAFFSSYGLAGVVAILILGMGILAAITKIIANALIKADYRELFLYACIVFSTILLTISTAFRSFTIFELVLLGFLLVMIFDFRERLITRPTDNYFAKKKMIQFTRISELKIFTRIMASTIWQDIFQTIRILVSLSLLVYVPQMIQFILTLFVNNNG